MDEEKIFCFGLNIFQVKLGMIGEDDENLNTLRNFSLYKFLEFLEGVQKIPGGGVKAIKKKTKTKPFFLCLP